MKFQEGLIVGGLTSTFAAIIIAGFVYYFWSYISPDIFAKDIEGAVTAMNKLNLDGKNIYIEANGQSSYEEQIKSFRNMSIPFIAKNKFSAVIGIGFMFSTVFSIFLRKKTNAV